MDAAALVRDAQAGLVALADPERARGMAAYLKATTPFYGVAAPDRRRLGRELRSAHRPETVHDYRAAVAALWELPHREEQYLALDHAAAFRRFIGPDVLDLYEHMVRTGGWWDLVDANAFHLVGGALAGDRSTVEPVMRDWIDDEDLWIRRTAILSQLGHKETTDPDLLFELCLRRAHEKEFFIRKAIGWALRTYARVDPGAVARFVEAHRDALSSLSVREATKHLS